jgi:hypothetical protein
MSGYLSERVDDLQQGADDLAAGDEVRKQTAILKAIAEEMGVGRDGWYDGAAELDAGETSEDDGTATYNYYREVTVKDGVDPTDQRVNLGLEADTVALLNVGGPVLAHLKSPGEDHSGIPASSEKVIVSGTDGINTRTVWLETQDSAGGDVTVDLFVIESGDD